MDLRQLAALLSAGVDLKTALAELQATQLPEELVLGIRLGAPLKTLLISLAQQQESLARSMAELSQALAMPKATRRLLLWLPVVTLALTIFTGISSFSSLINPLVLVSLLVGSLLLLLGNRISNKMLSGINYEFSISELQKFSIAIAAGMNVGQIANYFPQLLSAEPVARLISLTRRTGAGLVALVESEIENTLQRQLAEKITALRALSVRLLIPLGTTTLPAFMLFTVPPTMVGLTK
jgi:tight adherence protein B